MCVCVCEGGKKGGIILNGKIHVNGARALPFLFTFIRREAAELFLSAIHVNATGTVIPSLAPARLCTLMANELLQESECL